ncbi:MAG: peroxide stress protein YaaA, partial [Gammaproteobacteria bacterium]
MLAVLSPAKRLDFKTAPTTAKHSLPVFLQESKRLIGVLREKSPAEIAGLMNLSTKLADLNYARYGEWRTPFTPDNAKAAALAFKGDVYLGLDAATMNDRDWAWAQKHLRILSGLYGLLKPLDLIQPYRLEMGTRLANPRGEDLYQFWGQTLTKALNEAVTGQRRPVLVNLASQEYFDAVDPNAIAARIITPTFKDLKNGRYKFLSFYAKKARGLMARYIIDHRVSTLK